MLILQKTIKADILFHCILFWNILLCWSKPRWKYIQISVNEAKKEDSYARAMQFHTEKNYHESINFNSYHYLDGQTQAYIAKSKSKTYKLIIRKAKHDKTNWRRDSCTALIWSRVSKRCGNWLRAVKYYWFQQFLVKFSRVLLNFWMVSSY